MAISNRDRVARAPGALARRSSSLRRAHDARPQRGELGARVQRPRTTQAPTRRIDAPRYAPALLKAMDRYWGEVFSDTLDRTHRSIVNELIGVRNSWAHDHPFNSADTLRALDSVKRTLEAVSAKDQIEELDRSHYELMRTVFEEQARSKVRTRALALEGQPKAGLKPWREIITPHPNVASGRYAQAEFAADLAQVHRGEGADEYRNPVEFFRRTFLTEGLKRLLLGAMARLAGKGGDPVVELQTNFGGGKTHSMLALFHLADHANPASLPGVDGLMREAGLTANSKSTESGARWHGTFARST